MNGGENNSQPKRKELRIVGVSGHITTQLDNIAAHKGITRNEFLKSELPNLLKNYPDSWRQTPPDSD